MQIKTIAMLLAIGLPAGATTLFSSFGAGDTFVDGGLGIGGATGQIGYNAIAFAFTPGVDFTVTQIDLVLSLASGSGFIVDLDTSSGNVPSAVLGSWALPSPPFPAAVSTLTSSGIALAAGNTYWLAVLPGGTDTWGFWDANPDGVTAAAGLNKGTSWVNTGPGNSEGVFDIVGSDIVTPEPASCVLTCIGLAGCAGFQRFRVRRALARL